MMIAAIHLRQGDVVDAAVASDEPRFDERHNSRRASGREEVLRIEQRDTYDQPENETRRFVMFANGLSRSWDNTHLLDVQRPE